MRISDWSSDVCSSDLGTILTDINKDDLADTEKRTYMEQRIPLGRLGEPDDLVGPTVFLASDLARYVTGASMLVDGGMFLNLQRRKPPPRWTIGRWRSGGCRTSCSNISAKDRLTRCSTSGPPPIGGQSRCQSADNGRERRRAK